MAFRKICQNGSLNPYKNPVFPPFRLTGRKYGILMKEYFDIKKFFNDTATNEIYTLSLHDALPIYSTHYTWHS